MCRTVFWTLWKRERAGWFGRMALKHVNYHMWNELPVQVRCMIQGARGWCTGMTQRDGMGMEVGGGFRMVNTGIPMADSSQCMAKPIQYCKVKKKKLLRKLPQGWLVWIRASFREGIVWQLRRLGRTVQWQRWEQEQNTDEGRVQAALKPELQMGHALGSL